MGLFDMFREQNNYFSPEELTKSYQNNLAKKFTPGKADQRLDDLSITIGNDRENQRSGQRTQIDQDYFLRKKAQLTQYAEDILVQSIIRTRTNQVVRYATPAHLSPTGDGFRVVKKGKTYSSMTKKEQERSKELERFIYYTGKDQFDWRDNFSEFLAKIIYDYYVFDQVNIERIFESKSSNQLNHFNHVSAGNILIERFPKSVDRPKTYVQYVDHKKQSTYNSKDLVFKTFWSQPNVRSGGYGKSPVEATIPQLNYRTNAEQFNARFFSQGGLTRGMLLIDPGDGTTGSRASLDALRRNLTPAQSVNGSWKIPIMFGHDAKYVNMQQNSKDMEFTQFLGYLTNEICAVFNIQPEEINVNNRGGVNGSGKGSSVLNEGKTAQAKLNASKESGLIPLLKNIERLMTDSILAYVDNEYQFIFTPSDEEKAEKEVALIKSKEEVGLTINEGRAMMGLKPVENGDVPGSPAYIQYLNTIAKNDPDSNKELQQKDKNNPDKGVSGAEMAEEKQKQEAKEK